MDWWDWGSKEDHAKTMIKIHSFGKIIEPEDNGGRPKLVVPASNVIEFRII